MSQDNKSWIDALSDILSSPLPGTEKSAPQVDKPVVFTEDDDDDSLLDRITDVLSKPLPGSGHESEAQDSSQPDSTEPENPGETAVRDAEQDDADPVSTTAVAGADWMQREYERFNAHQDRNRQAFAENQRVEQERFAAYQRAQLDQFMASQERERGVFRHHQEMRFRTWQQDLRQTYSPQQTSPGQHAAGFRPVPPPPPPPPWWRKR